MLPPSRETAARTHSAVERVSVPRSRMSAEKLAAAVDRLVEITESISSRLEAVEKRLEKMTGAAPEGFTFEEVAKLLKCNPRTVARRVAEGTWGHFLLGAEDKRIPKSELVRITAARFAHSSAPMGPLPRRRLPASSGESEAAKIRAANRKPR